MRSLFRKRQRKSERREGRQEDGHEKRGKKKGTKNRSAVRYKRSSQIGYGWPETFHVSVFGVSRLTITGIAAVGLCLFSLNMPKSPNI